MAQLSRAIVVGPIARLELIPTEDHKPADNASPDSLIEAQIPCAAVQKMGFKGRETLVVHHAAPECFGSRRWRI